jgi:hypothetical protein
MSAQAAIPRLAALKVKSRRIIGEVLRLWGMPHFRFGAPNRL